MAMDTITKQDNNRADYRSAANLEMAPKIQRVRDVCAGTLHLRSKGTEYLPMEPREESAAYTIRLGKALLVNFTERAINSLVGLVFATDPELSEDVPLVMRGQEAVEGKPATETEPAIAAQPEIEGQLENCDLAGTHWQVFTKELFTDALRDGHAFLMTDMPPALFEGATKADEIAMNRRPYWVKYKADQALNWRTDSRGRLTQITFEECSVEPDGEYGEMEVKRYRVLRPGSWELYRKITDQSGNDALILEDAGLTSLAEIPVSAVYGRKCKPFISTPPMLDLSEVNILHYQESSDYRIYLRIASRPILWFRGRDKSKPVEVIGPYSIFDVGDNGEAKFAETTGAALGAARQDLKDMEEYMGLLGLQMLTQQAPEKTATEERGDQVRELSELATAAQSLHDCIEQGLMFWAEYLGEPTGGSVKLGVDVVDLTMSDQEMNAYNAMAGTVLSKQTVREILKERGKLSESYSEETEKARLAEESKAARENMPDLGRIFNAGAGLDGMNVTG